MSTIYEGIMSGLGEALDHATGKRELQTHDYSVTLSVILTTPRS